MSSEVTAESSAAPADQERPSLEDRVWSELRQLYDPEIPVNVVELGLIYGVQTSTLPEGGRRVEVIMTVTSPACGMSEFLRADAEARLRRLPNVSEVAVEVVFDPPWSPELMSESARLMLNL